VLSTFVKVRQQWQQIDRQQTLFSVKKILDPHLIRITAKI